MRKTIIVLSASVLMSLAAVPASAQSSRTLTGAAIGAGSGAIIAGPPGAVIGGVIGAVVGGPAVPSRRSYQKCWYDKRGYQRCKWVR
ncbi:MAG TPA: hypothetical protein VM867_05360 [Xanthobacteraceae bacterium]|jgi:uncharacterized membrane protein|nr:hypothetical protein [Xanthobacteraceae bacterium]